MISLSLGSECVQVRLPGPLHRPQKSQVQKEFALVAREV
jgi:hypothetical protein